MRVGLLAYSTNTGLGIQTYNFYKHMKPDKVLLVDISSLNGMKTHHERYPDAFITTNGLPKRHEVDSFLTDLDVVFVCETPLNWYMFERARELGVKTVLQYNFELLDHFEFPELPKPDLFAAPSYWGIDQVPFENKQFLPVPIEIDEIVPSFPNAARTFLHIAGRPAAADRNGTEIFLQAADTLNKLMGDRLKFIVRIQDEVRGAELKAQYPFAEVIAGDIDDNYELYRNADVLVMPRKYGGLCLPVNEALAHGMPVIMPNISPNDFWLPDHWLVPAEKTGEIWTRRMIDVYEVKPTHLALKMLELVDLKAQEGDEPIVGGVHFKAEAKEARTIAEQFGWAGLKKVYTKVFEDLICQS